MRVVTPVLLALLLASAAVAVTTVTEEQAPGARAPAAPARTPPAVPRAYPRLPQDPAAIAAELAALEPALRSPATSPDQLPELAHRQQVIYRRLATDPALAARVRGVLPVRWQGVLDRHLAARREFLAMHRGDRVRPSFPPGGSSHRSLPPTCCATTARRRRPPASPGRSWPR